ncbi:hypothetical protein Lpp70_00480 [Lacticaseibacillus paracasei subsp. paracasei Lpp70]|nr:hypothetical protein Lpp70_00480 [Lacticaseibacillus paracasei subsp. paracasei Lpp70]
MSEEKLYAVKNDKGKYWDFSCNSGWWSSKIAYPTTTIAKKQAELVADERGGHVVTFVEEPEKVVLTKEQAKIVETARDKKYPANYICANYDSEASGEQELLMNAYVNGYTVAKEKRYMVPLDGLVTTDGSQQYLTKRNGKWFASRIQPSLHQAFTDEELKLAPIWAEEIDREEVTDDENN